MKELFTPEEFEEAINKDYPIVIIFFKPNCGTCKMYFNGLKSIDTTNFYKIDIDGEYSEYYRFTVKMRMFMPDTRIYYKGEKISSDIGVLFTKQLRELKEKMKNINT